MNGLDISKWQAGLDLNEVKKAGYDFVILRGGYTGNGATRSFNVDYTFEDFYAQAKAIGLNVGVYYYSCATNGDEGRAEAEFLYKNCLEGKRFEMPIYIDVEDSNYQTGKRAGITDATISFCDYLRDKGFLAGLYASKYWILNNMDYPRLNCEIWVASWSSLKPEVPFEYGMWQNSSDGRVDNYRVDTDVCYKDYPSEIKAQGLNGYGGGTPEPEPTPVPFTNYVIGDTVSFKAIYVSSTSSQALRPLVDSGTITKIINGAPNPYLINNGTGWVNDSVITNKHTNDLQVGDHIMIVDGAKDLNTGGKYADFVYNTVYAVIQIKGSRVVFGLDGNITGATDINNCLRV